MNSQPPTVDIEVLKNILTNLVTVPESVEITRDVDELGVQLSVKVNAVDMGLVIGRNGGMAKAIKTVMTAIGMAHKMRIRVQILEPDGSTKFGEDEQPQSNARSFSKPTPPPTSDFDEFALN